MIDRISEEFLAPSLLGLLRSNLVVPNAGIEPARLAAGDFLTTSAFAAAARKSNVRGLEHAFTLAFRP